MQYHNKYPDCVILSSFETATYSCRPNYNSHTVLSIKAELIVDQLETFQTDNSYCRSLLSSCSTPSRNSWTQQHSRLLSSKLLRLTNRAAFITSNFSVAFIFFITEKRQTNFQYPLYTAPIWFAYIFPHRKKKKVNFVHWYFDVKITKYEKIKSSKFWLTILRLV